MQLHADLTRPALVDTNALDWAASPMPGVERRMIERDGAEVARATSLVRYAPGSAFSGHAHDLGEEFLVLDGVFTDETGDFPAGMYVRNPPGSHHIPSSVPGTTIFVKLRQMDPSDTAFVRVNTLSGDGWKEGRAGERILPLHEDARETVTMHELAAKAELGPEIFPGGVELYILSGSAVVDGTLQDAGTWLRLPAGSTLALGSENGARIWRKAGHLREIEG